ncbi:carboxyl transferase domain-containing protein [Kineococcus sp. SYSU DK004]|uniref:carboxyl transferase domain-containing protein n=1 Tax=Kineococcus sp. SYSU DK004 TaxID=3383125 RepID=UPI003D7C9EE2
MSTTENPAPDTGPGAVREFAAALFDDGAATPATPVADGSAGGWGAVDGRDVCLAVLGEDPGGRVLALAARTGRPLVTVVPDGAAVDARALGEIARAGVALSGVVPQVAVVLGAADGAAALLLPLADVVVAVRGARSALADPAAAQVVTGVAREADDLGGTDLHAAATGRFAHVADDPAAAGEFVRDLLAHLPSNNRATAPRLPGAVPDPSEEDPDLAALLPEDAGAPYDVRDVVARLADEPEEGAPAFLELRAAHAPHLVTGLTRLDGRSLGVVAPQPAVRGGALDAAAAAKAARFVRWCDAFGLPVLTLVDTAGAVPAGEDDPDAPTFALAQLLYACAEATTPLLTVVTGRAHGPARTALASRYAGADLVLAWPRALVADRDEVASAAGAGDEEWTAALRAAREDAGPARAAGRGELDGVVEPAATRARLAASLRLLERVTGSQPARRHGNLPL